MEVYLLSNEKCSNCGSENIDKGVIGGGFLGYKSHKQGIFSDPIREFKAQACLDCGFIDIYVNVDKLKRKIKK